MKLTFAWLFISLGYKDSIYLLKLCQEKGKIVINGSITNRVGVFDPIRIMPVVIIERSYLFSLGLVFYTLTL